MSDYQVTPTTINNTYDELSTCIDDLAALKVKRFNLQEEFETLKADMFYRDAVQGSNDAKRAAWLRENFSTYYIDLAALDALIIQAEADLKIAEKQESRLKFLMQLMEYTRPVVIPKE